MTVITTGMRSQATSREAASTCCSPWSSLPQCCWHVEETNSYGHHDPRSVIMEMSLPSTHFRRTSATFTVGLLPAPFLTSSSTTSLIYLPLPNWTLLPELLPYTISLANLLQRQYSNYSYKFRPRWCIASDAPIPQAAASSVGLHIKVNSWELLAMCTWR